MSANFHFMGLKRPLNWLKNNKDRRKVKRNCETLSKVKCAQTSYKNVLYGLLLGVSTVKRSVLGDNANWT